jgi:poly-beta-hydroxyalkanoate depolymerase
LKLIVDRIEEGFAVCELENGSIVNFGLKMLPEGVREGTVLNLEGETITIDEIETQNKKKAANKLLDDLF